MTASLRSSGFRESSPRRVLIVDDHAQSAADLQLLLEHEGHTVRVAASGVEAITTVSSFLPDVALIDLGLPDGDGHDLVGVLRLQPGLAQCRFIAGIGSSGPSQNGSASFAAHLTKPENSDELLSLIEETRHGERAAG